VSLDHKLIKYSLQSRRLIFNRACKIKILLDNLSLIRLVRYDTSLSN
jgi:hypothetical protein